MRIGMRVAAVLSVLIVLVSGCRDSYDDSEEKGKIFFSSFFADYELAFMEADSPSERHQVSYTASMVDYITNAAGKVSMGGVSYIVHFTSGGQLNLFDTYTFSSNVIPSFASTYAAKISPDQTRILVNSAASQYYIYNIDNSTSYPLSTVTPSAASPDQNMITWSPDSQYVALVSNHSTNDEIYVYSLSDGGLTLLTSFGSSFSRQQPAWSPDGDWIAFTSNCLSPLLNNNIMIVRPDGTEMRRLTSGEDTIETTPLWSPNGKMVAYLIDNGVGSNALGSIKSDGSSQKQLTEHSGSGVSGVSWSPYGTKIVFCANWTGFGEIYTIDPDGGDLKQLTYWGTPSASPSWISD